GDLLVLSCRNQLGLLLGDLDRGGHGHGLGHLRGLHGCDRNVDFLNQLLRYDVVDGNRNHLGLSLGHLDDLLHGNQPGLGLIHVGCLGDTADDRPRDINLLVGAGGLRGIATGSVTAASAGPATATAQATATAAAMTAPV